MSRIATFYDIVRNAPDGTCLCMATPKEGEPMDIDVIEDGVTTTHHLLICPNCQPFIPEFLLLLEDDPS